MAARLLDHVDDCVESVLSKVGKRIVLGTPLGIGKPNHLLNAFYRRAARDASIQLKIITALSLERPRAKSELVRRFLEPFAARGWGGAVRRLVDDAQVWGDYPELEYMQALRARRLPANIELSEFYFKSGSMLGVTPAQLNYVSSNYTHVARDMLAAGVNVVAQALA